SAPLEDSGRGVTIQNRAPFWRHGPPILTDDRPLPRWPVPPTYLQPVLHLIRRTHAPASDADLLGRYTAARDGDAFAALVARHGRLVWGACRRVLGDRHAAEDAFQDTFLELARRAQSIRDPAALPAWLYGVAVRTAGQA